MHSNGAREGYRPPLQFSNRPGVAPVLYSAAIQHLGVDSNEDHRIWWVPGVGLTVWITRARQGWGFEPLPVRAVLGCCSWGGHLGGAGHLPALGGLATPPGSSTLELGALREPALELIEFRELPPTPPLEKEADDDGLSSCSRWRVH